MVAGRTRGMIMARGTTRSERSNIVENRIREVRQRRGMSLEELGAAIGVSFSTVAKLERSQRTLSLDLLTTIAKALGVTPGELIGGPQVGPPLRTVPIIGKIAAGNWREAIEDPIGHVAVPDAGPNAFALVPDGDSMDLVAPEGSIIVIDPDMKELAEGRMYAVMNREHETTFKRYRSDPPRLEPCSSNPAHKPIPLLSEPMEMIGRVVWQARPM